MMTQPKDNGGPAYPAETIERTGMHSSKRVLNGGMTLRDWFAGHALAGIASTDGSATHITDARNAYLWADAMLEARK
jgi:hypothetical protein